MTATSKDTTIYITGFGPFGSIQVNPSSQIGEQLANDLQRNGFSHVHYTSLRTSVTATSSFFDTLEATLDKEVGTAAAAPILLFHIGVHSKEDHGVLRLEVRAYNELYASVPDADGRVLNHEPINEADGPIDHYLDSWFGKDDTAVNELIGKLNAKTKTGVQLPPASAPAHGSVPPPLPVRFLSSSHDTNGRAMQMPSFLRPHWEVSRDAGRYLCNFALYRALKLQEKYPRRVVAVFVHVADPSKGPGREVSKSNGITETIEGAYNPGILTQTEQVKALMEHLLQRMASFP